MSKEYIDLISDKPIESSSQDFFNRKDFVQSISDIIYDQYTEVNEYNSPELKNADENLIIGIFGEWGFGKSSVLNLIRENLSKRSVVTTLFNPWMYKNEETLILSLFHTICEKTELKGGSSRTELWKYFVQYYQLLTVFSKTAREFENILKLVNSNHEPFNALECRHKINEILLGTANPLVIFIDDVDRLSKDEIHILFKTMRLVASFRHVIYVTAFDLEMVSKSIKENYVDGKIEDGKFFIEKIVQLSFRIPEIRTDTLSRYTLRLIGETVNHDLREDPLFKLIFEGYYRTPRDVKRFTNSLRVTYHKFKESIDPRDLVIIELIQNKAYDLFEAIKIYYRACKAITPEKTFGLMIKEFYSTSKPEFFKPDGAFKNEHHELSIFQACFKQLLNTSHISFNHRVSNRNTDYNSYLSHPEILKLRSFRNPQILISYFEASIESNTT